MTIQQGTVMAAGPSIGVLPSYEVVLSADDFFISVNGPVIPSECSGFLVNENGCLVLRHDEGDVILLPVPAKFMELISSIARILFVKFWDGEVVDTCELPRAFGV